MRNENWNEDWDEELNEPQDWNRVKFGLRLATIRNRHNISARQLSLELGYNRNYIWTIESGNGLPTMESFFDICKYLQVAPEEFFRDAPEQFFFSYFLDVLEKLDEIQLQHLFQLAEDLANNH